MANEFVARNGLIAQDNSTITGSLRVTGGITGSFSGTASWAQNALTASTTTNIIGASNQLAFFNSSNSITSSANLRFVNNNASLTGSLTIQSSGTEAINLGTSATNPDQQVDIRLASGGARGIRIYASSSPLSDKPTGAGFQFYTTSSVNFPGHVYFDSAANDNAAIIFRTSQTNQFITERMRITSAGNVLIGDSTDSGYKLDVNGTTRLQGALTISTGGANIIGNTTITGGDVTISGSLFVSGATQSGGNSNILTYDSSTGQVFFTASSAIGGGGGTSIFMRNKTNASSTDTVTVNQSIFNPSNLSVLSTSIFIIEEEADYYTLGNLANSGSMIVSGTLKIGGILYNSGSIVGPGIIE